MPEVNKVSVGLADEQATKLETYEMPVGMAEAIFYYQKKLKQARDQRVQPRVELDDLDYETDYELNRRAANAYLRKKKNDDEVRIATGATEKKIEVVMNELLSLNLQPEITAYDKYDSEIDKLGENFEGIVKRTNETEGMCGDDDFWREFVHEMLTQRIVFIEELDEYIKTFSSSNLNCVDGTNESEGVKDEYVHRAIKRVLPGLQVFLGDMNIPAYRFNEQPYILKYYRKTYDEAKIKYGGWENFKYVSKGQTKSSQGPAFYRVSTLDPEEVEEIHYINPHLNEYQVLINMIPMFDKPMKCPWTIRPDNKFNMSAIVLKPISRTFALGKPLTASAKVLQGLNDEMIRLLVRKFRQAIEPPMAVLSDKILSKDIWLSGAMTQGISKDDFEILNPSNQGVTSAEFQMIQLVSKEVEQFVGVPNIAQGFSDEGGKPTATQLTMQQRNFVKQLGQAVLSLYKAKREATYLRIYNLLDNFTKPVTKTIDPISGAVQEIYNKWTVNGADLGGGKMGKKSIQMTNRPLSEDELSSVYQMENEMSQSGTPHRFSFINLGLLNSVSTLWKVMINEKERDGSALEKVMFTDKLEQAAGVTKLTGRQINPDTAVEEFESTWKTKNMFVKGNQPSQNQVPEELQGMDEKLAALGQTRVGDQLQEGAVAGATNKPSVNTMAAAV
jgi:hypothetical protein